MKLLENIPALTLGLLTMLTLSGCGQATEPSAVANGGEQQHDHAEHGDHPVKPDAPNTPAQSGPANAVAAPYPLDTCVVAGGKLGSMGKPVTLVNEGREVKFCCAACEPKFKADPDKYIQKIDQAVVEQQAERYPLETCLISGDALGDKPVDFVYENRLVRLCCAMCVDTFLKDPNTHLAKLNEAAVKAQLADYPAKTCPITGLDLGSMGKPIDMMVGDRLVRLCCAGCVEKTRENPAGVLGKVYPTPAAPAESAAE